MKVLTMHGASVRHLHVGPRYIGLLTETGKTQLWVYMIRRVNAHLTRRGEDCNRDRDEKKSDILKYDKMYDKIRGKIVFDHICLSTFLIYY